MCRQGIQRSAYTKTDKTILIKNPEMKGARTLMKQMIAETQQDRKTKMAVTCFI